MSTFSSIALGIIVIRLMVLVYRWYVSRKDSRHLDNRIQVDRHSFYWMLKKEGHFKGNSDLVFVWLMRVHALRKGFSPRPQDLLVVDYDFKADRIVKFVSEEFRRRDLGFSETIEADLAGLMVRNRLTVEALIGFLDTYAGEPLPQ